ncbi:hypothetical protein NFI96_008842 [Prochilodus magdalenae]|nr:hypothetical protein NFI96_008842 [Prochilodus magdalenae]
MSTSGKGSEPLSSCGCFDFGRMVRWVSPPRLKRDSSLKMTRCHSESLHDSLSCVVQPSADGAALTGGLMEDTTARWRSVMVELGQSGLYVAAEMKKVPMGVGRTVMARFYRDRTWDRTLLVLLIVLKVFAAHSSMVPGTLELQLDEEQPAGTVVGDISAGLPPGVTAALYFISDHEGTGVGTDLDIDESTGIIKTAKVLDREVRDHYNFIAVTMTGVTVEVTIVVNDINDHAPTFPRKRATFKIPEQTTIGTKFPLDPALDADKDQLATQGYIITDGNVGQAFLLETRRGSNQVLYLDLVVNAVLDRERRSSYTLLLEAFDGGSPKKTGQMILDVTVQDINDNAPVFNQSRYHTMISENLQPGNNILQVFASDADEGDNGLVLYEINRRQSDPDHYFVIDSRTGVITLNKPLDYELRRVHELVVQARDNATHPEVTNAFVTIHVRDYNDNQPTMTIIFLSEDGSPRISEGAQPGQYVARISVTDPDYGEYANVNVSLEGGDGKFALTTKDNIIYLICVDEILDREERDQYELRVMATDSGTPPLQAESSFTIQVTDVNDNPPLFDQQEYTQVIPEVIFPGSFVLQVTARDKDQGPNGEVQYSILQNLETHSGWFSIDAVTGIITTLTQLDYEMDPAPSLIVVATDRGRPPLSATAVVKVILQDINDNEPVFESKFYNASLKENTAAGTCFMEVRPRFLFPQRPGLFLGLTAWRLMMAFKLSSLFVVDNSRLIKPERLVKEIDFDTPVSRGHFGE